MDGVGIDVDRAVPRKSTVSRPKNWVATDRRAGVDGARSRAPARTRNLANGLFRSALSPIPSASRLSCVRWRFATWLNPPNERSVRRGSHAGSAEAMTPATKSDGAAEEEMSNGTLASAMFLTDADLRSLTGYTRPAEHRRWLTSHGWAFEIRADGKNRVLIEEAQAKMLTRQTVNKWSPKKAGRSAEPDLAALRTLG